MLTYESLLPMLDARVSSILSKQVLDRSRPDCGGFVDYGLAGGTGVGQVVPLCYAYLLKGSTHFRSTEILERILLGAGFGRRIRRESGRFDLVETNFDSAPDTGFLVQSMAPVVAAARQVADDAGAEEIAEALGELIRTATPGMADGGFHTPNHRWVLVSALAQVRALFPDLDVMDAIEAYLAETIDINADGEYTERSTGVYNAVCNRSLRIAAKALDRPELLDPVRKNLDHSYHLLHADGTVVTSVSQRQDRGTQTIPVGLVDSYYAMARMEENGFYAAVADWLIDQETAGPPWTLHPFLEHPEWREDNLKRERLPESYSKVYPVSGIWRVRRGRMRRPRGYWRVKIERGLRRTTGQLRKVEPVTSLRRDEGGDGTGHGAATGLPDQVSRPFLLFGVFEHALGGPPCVNSVLAVRDDSLAARILRQVAHFARVLLHVEKLAGSEFMIVVQLPRSAADHTGGSVAQQADVL